MYEGILVYNKILGWLNPCAESINNLFNAVWIFLENISII